MVKTIVNMVHSGSFSPTDIRQLAEPVRFGLIVNILLKLLTKIGVINIFWNQQLKENHAYEKRFDRPFVS
jgi:hypothetical protein